MSQGLIKASHDGVREKYRLREREEVGMLLLPLLLSIIHNIM